MVFIRCLSFVHVCQLVLVDVTNYHRLDSLYDRHLHFTVLEDRSVKSTARDNWSSAVASFQAADLFPNVTVH